MWDINQFAWPASSVVIFSFSVGVWASLECSTSPWVWQLPAKLTCLTSPICDRVEEHLICCGNLSIVGGGWGLLLIFCRPLVIVNTWFLIVVHPILFNLVVFSAFLFSWMDLDQHRYLSFGCGTLGCWDGDYSVLSRGHLEIWPTVVQSAA